MIRNKKISRFRRVPCSQLQGQMTCNELRHIKLRLGSINNSDTIHSLRTLHHNILWSIVHRVLVNHAIPTDDSWNFYCRASKWHKWQLHETQHEAKSPSAIVSHTLAWIYRLSNLAKKNLKMFDRKENGTLPTSLKCMSCERNWYLSCDKTRHYYCGLGGWYQMTTAIQAKYQTVRCITGTISWYSTILQHVSKNCSVWLSTR